MPDVIKFFLAFLVVLALIGIIAWVARRFMAGRINTGAGRGRMPRLSVVDAAEFGDGRRKLVIVRRDNVEHLLMVGGPSDVVIETNISRAAPVVGRDAPRASDPSWLDSDTPEPAPMPEPPRPPRPALAGDEPRRPPPPMPPPPERRPEPRQEPRQEMRQEPMRQEPMANFAAESMRPPMRTAKPPMPRQPVAAAAPPVAPPVVVPAAAAVSEAASQADQNLAEMARHLEAALRRPGTEAGPSVAVSPVDRIGAPSVAPDGPPARKAPPVEPPTAAAEPAHKEETGFESLEAEMANLLGRPKNPS